MSLPDPRVPQGSVYDRDVVISAVTKFYRLLAELPYVQPEHILYPPPEGWANITSEVVQGDFHKTDEVLNLLRHLPYLNQDRGKGMAPYLTGQDVAPCDFRRDCIQDKENALTQRMLAPERPILPPHCIIIATAMSQGGADVILDTSDGTITEYEQWVYRYDPDYAPDDPRAWRNACKWDEDVTQRTQTVTNYFEQLSGKFHALEHIGWWKATMPHVWLDPNDSDLKEMRDIIQAHGWPNDFRRDDCWQALTAWRVAKRAARTRR